MLNKKIFLYNTLTRKEEFFEPLNNDQVTMYCCGPTVYDFAHIGNLRAYIAEDLLRRTLRYAGYPIKHVMNITDVGHLTSDADTGEDKLEIAAKREKLDAWLVAAKYTELFFSDLKKLNIELPDISSKATDHIADMIELIKKLAEKGYTYKTADGIYFDTTKFPTYGELTQLQKQKLQAGMRIDMGEKKNEHDFALWKFSLKNEKRQMEWKSPWGIGFPGWHIECSAMAMKYFGEQFDIHCGGVDHISIHHTNEIAQSYCATGKIPARDWFHVAFLNINGEKISKSKGNFITLQEIIDKGFDPLAFRYFILSGHYRTQMDFSWEALQAAQNSLERLRHIAADLTELENNKDFTDLFQLDEIEKNYWEHWKNVLETALLNDLNTPVVLSSFWTAIREDINRKAVQLQLLKWLDDIFVLDLFNTNTFFPEEIQKIKEERDRARAQKDWTCADALRILLEEKNFEVIDRDDETFLRKK